MTLNLQGQTIQLEQIKPDLEQVKDDFKRLSSEYSRKHAELLAMLKSSSKEIQGLSKEEEKLQNDRSLLLVEAMKYEGLGRYLQTEKMLIDKAMVDSKQVDPSISAVDYEKAESKRKFLEKNIGNLLNDWHQKLAGVQEQAERDLSREEIEDYTQRVAIMESAMERKNKEIERIALDNKIASR